MDMSFLAQTWNAKLAMNKAKEKMAILLKRKVVKQHKFKYLSNPAKNRRQNWSWVKNSNKVQEIQEAKSNELVVLGQNQWCSFKK